MPVPNRMKFGVFMAPFHRVGENPTLALERDLELLQWLDTLGFDEAYIGEHHSAGWETIASPELFMATAAERTRHIRLGTGVTSLPYHHPFMVANRMVLLDHLTRGRVRSAAVAMNTSGEAMVSHPALWCSPMYAWSNPSVSSHWSSSKSRSRAKVGFSPTR